MEQWAYFNQQENNISKIWFEKGNKHISDIYDYRTHKFTPFKNLLTCMKYQKKNYLL